MTKLNPEILKELNQEEKLNKIEDQLEIEINNSINDKKNDIKTF